MPTDEKKKEDRAPLFKPEDFAHSKGDWVCFAKGTCVGGPVGPIPNPSGGDTAGVAMCGMNLRTPGEIAGNVALIIAAPKMLRSLMNIVNAGAVSRFELEQIRGLLFDISTHKEVTDELAPKS